MPLYREPEKLSREELPFASPVDAAWNSQGQSTRHVQSLILVFLFAAFIAWAMWASVDEVTRGQGQVVPSQRVQVIQHLEGGILNEVLVTEGQQVSIDQPVARVDNVGVASVLRDMQTRIAEKEATIIRLEAELNEKALDFPEALQSQAPSAVESEKNAYAARKQQRVEEVNILQSQLEQREQELTELSNRKETFTQALELAQRRADLAKPLLARKLYPEVDYLSLQQEIVRLKGEISTFTTSIAKGESAIREANQRLSLGGAEFKSEVVKELNLRKSELASLRESLTAGADRVTRTELRSPVSGIVNRIILNTKGGVVQPGEPIMEIVPIDDTLLIEAQIRPADIAFIHPGQKAIVKLTAYDYAIYGSLNGLVEQLSADSLTGPRGEVYFLVKVRTNENAIHYRDQILPIMPGMVASVDILTGKKTIMQYLLKPITKARDNALRER